MKKRILVTGGAGFVGSHLVDALLEKGHEVCVFDNLDPQVHGPGQNVPRYLNKGCCFIQGDIRDKDALKDALKKADVIFHLAAAVGVGQSMYQIQKYIEVNVLGTSILLDLLVNERHNVEKLIVASSMSIYGEGAYKCEGCGIVSPKIRLDRQLSKKDWDMKCPHCNSKVRSISTDEDKRLLPASVYAISKKNQEEMCLVVGNSYKIPVVALRYFNIYGSRQALSNPYTGVCAIFSSRIKNDKPPLVFEDGLQTRDFIHVKDIIQANLLVLENSDADYRIFNVGTESPTSILEIARTLAKVHDKHIQPQVMHKYRVGDIRHCYADIARIKRLGFRPNVTLDEGIRELIQWSRTIEARDDLDAAIGKLCDRGLTF